MSPGAAISIGVAGLWFVSVVAFAARPSPATQLFHGLLSLGAVGCGFGCLVRILPHWRRRYGQGIALLSTAVVLGVLAGAAGAWVQEIVFRRSLPSFEGIVHRMDSGAIPVTAEWRRFPGAEGGGAYAVSAQRSTNGVLTVEFLTGSGFPVKHSGYLYCSGGSIEPGSIAARRWPRRQRVSPIWYRISD